MSQSTRCWSLGEGQERPSPPTWVLDQLETKDGGRTGLNPHLCYPADLRDSVFSLWSVGHPNTKLGSLPALGLPWAALPTQEQILCMSHYGYRSSRSSKAENVLPLPKEPKTGARLLQLHFPSYVRRSNSGFLPPKEICGEGSEGDRAPGTPPIRGKEEMPPMQPTVHPKSSFLK